MPMLGYVTWQSMLQAWWPAVLSGVCIVLALAAYLWFCKRIQRRIGQEKAQRRHKLLLAIGLILALLIALAHIWQGHLRWAGYLSGWVQANEISRNILWTLVAVVAVYSLGRVVERALLRRAVDLEGKHKARRAVAWCRTVVLILCVGSIWIRGVQMGLFLGFVGAGIALSLQETLLCIAGWALIVVKKPFDIGDRIEISGLLGDVIDIRVFQTSLLEVGNWVGADQSTGRIINVPNSAVFRGLNANYTKGFPFIWDEQTIVVTFESDWKLAKQIILKQAQEEAEKIENEVRRQIEAMRGRYAIRYEQLGPTVYTHIASHGAALTLRYLCPVRQRRGMAHLISEGILEDFAREEGIDLAYPTTRFYDAGRESRLATTCARDRLEHAPPRQGQTP